MGEEMEGWKSEGRKRDKGGMEGGGKEGGRGLQGNDGGCGRRVSRCDSRGWREESTRWGEDRREQQL